MGALGLMVFEKKIFFKDLYYVSLHKTNEPLIGASFDPRAIIWTTLVEVY